MDPKIDQRAKKCQAHNEIQMLKDAENQEVKLWEKKTKRKKAISRQQNPAVIVSWTPAVALSEHTAVTARTCRIADTKVAADTKRFKT